MRNIPIYGKNKETQIYMKLKVENKILINYMSR
jgi:hypothetical protein